MSVATATIERVTIPKDLGVVLATITLLSRDKALGLLSAANKAIQNRVGTTP